MKRKALKLMAITFLLLVGNFSYAENQDMTVVEKGAGVKPGSGGRAVGGLLSKKSTDNSNSGSNSSGNVDAYKKRIEELESVVSQQQKLIELYKNKQN
jgi:hypothetical protein